MSGGAYAAIDVGASSGRVVVGLVGDKRLDLQEVYRFPNGPVRTATGLHWDAAELRRHVLVGLRAAAEYAAIDGIGIDTWGVDYGLLDETGRLIGDPFAYRDVRTARGVSTVHSVIDPDELYRRNGLQFLPFNTIYQLAADAPESLARAATMLLMPDLVGHWLTGTAVAERTNASTTGLLDPSSGAWSVDTIDELGLPRRIFPELHAPGDALGRVRPDIAETTRLGWGAEVILVGSHDTASAVVGVPAEHERFAYISCGTWGLVGLELEKPVVTDESRAANFTNELGVDGRVRFLRNVMGLWLLQESMRTWAERGEPVQLEALVAEAGALGPGGPVVDPNDAAFLPPGDMPSRIDAACRSSGQPAPTTRAAVVRCILDSLAIAFAAAVRDASRLAGRGVEVVHLVGGGVRNELLCQLVANACGLPVVAGPVEATAIGNLVVQARFGGWVEGDLEAIRRRIRASVPLRRFEATSGPTSVESLS